MDPLSITASTLTVLSALVTALQLIRTYRGAPGQLGALENEISEITLAVTEVDRIIKEYHDKIGLLDDKGSHLALALANIREKASMLEALFYSCGNPPKSIVNGSSVSRFSWLKVRSKVQSLQMELRDGRLKLSIALATLTA